MSIDKFTYLYNHHYQRFFRFANNYIHDEAVAEDLVVDAMLYFWENRSRLPEEMNEVAYIFTTIKHKCLNYLQHLSIETEVHDKLYEAKQWEVATKIATLEAFDPNDLYNKEILVLVEESLSKFSPQTQIIFRMSRFENMSHKEIAQKMGISTKSVEFHISKVLKELRLSLKDYLVILLGILCGNLLH